MNTNGVVSFLVAVSQYTPDPFPLGDQRRLISPFWGDVDTRNGGTVSYRESTDTLLLQRATADIRRAFVIHQKFTATWIFIGTWDRVAFYGASGSMQSKVCWAIDFLKVLRVSFLVPVVGPGSYVLKSLPTRSEPASRVSCFDWLLTVG